MDLGGARQHRLTRMLSAVASTHVHAQPATSQATVVSGASGASADPGRPDISKILTPPLRLNKGVEEIAAESCCAHYNGITVRWAARPVGIGNCGDALHSLRRRRWKRRPWAMWIHSHVRVRARPTNCTESPQASQHQYYDAIIGPLSEY